MTRRWKYYPAIIGVPQRYTPGTLRASEIAYACQRTSAESDREGKSIASPFGNYRVGLGYSDVRRRVEI